RARAYAAGTGDIRLRRQHRPAQSATRRLVYPEYPRAAKRQRHGDDPENTPSSHYRIQRRNHMSVENSIQIQVVQVGDRLVATHDEYYTFGQKIGGGGAMKSDKTT